MSSIIANKKDFYQLANNRFKFQLFLLARLPAAYIAGVKIENCNQESCSVSVPFKWLTKNPFRSTYFACLSMAAEMSTGALAMANLYKRTPAASMLITLVESKYYKKATGKTTFICHDGRKIRDTIDTAYQTFLPQTFTAKSEGYNEQEDLVSEFWFTWSFKVKQ